LQSTEVFINGNGVYRVRQPSPEPLDELITPVFPKQVIIMLKIDIPLRFFRAALQRSSQFCKGRSEEAKRGAQSENHDPIQVDQIGVQEKRPERQPLEDRVDRIFVFFRGIARAGGIGLLVAVVLAAIPWFEPELQPFQTRLTDFIQQYAIPICSALLIWYGVRAAL
jgi:hypothetical protein